MVLLDRLKARFGEDADPLYPYRCTDCGAEFEVREVRTSQVECPECDTSDSRSITSL